jgi:hypothetical protein
LCKHQLPHPQQCAQLTAFDRQVSCVARSRNVRDPRLWVSASPLPREGSGNLSWFLAESSSSPGLSAHLPQTSTPWAHTPQPNVVLITSRLSNPPHHSALDMSAVGQHGAVMPVAPAAAQVKGVCACLPPNALQCIHATCWRIAQWCQPSRQTTRCPRLSWSCCCGQPQTDTCQLLVMLLARCAFGRTRSMMRANMLASTCTALSQP